jgi:pyruvate,water dikinase
MVPATAAGVAFTANPVTGARDETLVNAVAGLADRFVAGEQDADEWVVTAGTARRVASADGTDPIDAARAEAVAELAGRVADHLGGPQDIEWALAGDEVSLLQSRPITALPPPPVAPVPIPIEVPPGFWAREAVHAPNLLSPLAVSVLMYENVALARMADEYGMLFQLTLREIGGWAYTSVAPVGGRPGMKPPPGWVMWILARTVPPLRRQIRKCVAAVRDDRALANVERWHGEWRAAMEDRLSALREVDRAALDDAALDAHLGELSALHHDATDIHHLLNGAQMLILGEYLLACRELLGDGWDDDRVLATLAGLSTKSTEPARELSALTQRVAADGTLAEIAAADADFAKAVEAYQGGYACRVFGYDLAEPTMAETPGLLVELIRGQLARGYDPDAHERALAERRREAAAGVRAALAGRADDLARFERLLRRAEQAYPIRDGVEFLTVSGPLAVIRLAVLEAGRRLAARGQLDRAEDVFLVEFDELRAALVGGDDLRPAATRRRGERAWAAVHPGPDSYGRDPGPPPSFAPFPPEVRVAMESVGVMVEKILALTALATPAPPGADGSLTGIPASAGRYRGPVRVIRDEQEFDKLRPGDVLVCPVTSPVWSVLFPSVGALVTDSGGTLSHQAIIAREYRIPAVVAAGSATTTLTDGQIVTVDGTRGVVEIVG